MLSIRAAQRQAGFTLIEILVTVVILSIGLLGIAGMQASSLRNNHVAYTETQAANLVMDMADRIRANPVAAQGNDYLYDTNVSVATDPGCINTGCTPAQLAQFDRYEWSIPILGKSTAVTSTTSPALSDGRGIITKNGDQFTITLLWREPAVNKDNDIKHKQCITGQGSDFACFQMRFQP